MEQRRCVVSKTATNDGSESEIKTSTDVFPSVIERIMGCSPKHKVNVVQFFTKVSVCVLALWILNCPSNTNFTENWDNSSNNGDTGMMPILWATKNRSLSQVEVLRMTIYDPTYCKPWDKASSYTEVSKVPDKMPPPSTPQKGPKNMPPQGPPPPGPPNGRPQGPPNGYQQNGPPKGPPPPGPPNRYQQNGPPKGPPPPGPPNGRPQGPPNVFPPRGPPSGSLQGPPKVSPPQGPPSGSPEGPAKASPPQVPPSGSQEGPAKASPPQGPSNDNPSGSPNDSPSSPASESSKSAPSENKSKVYSKDNPPPVPPRKRRAPKSPVMFEHHKQFFQQTEANKKLEVIDPSYQNLKDMKKDRDNKIVARSPPSNKRRNVNPANNMEIVRRPAPQKIRVQKVQEDENGILGEFANSIMSNIHEVEMDRNPALELIKENIIDNIISANRGVKKNIDFIRENITNTLKTIENGDWKPPLELIKETILEKIGSLDPEEIRPKFEEIKGAIIEKITANIESEVRPKFDNIKLTVLDTLDDINNGVVQPRINDIKDTINRNIGNLDYEVIPKIGNTIKDCVVDKIGDISSGIGKTSEAIKDTVMTNVKTIYDNVPVPKNIKEMANKIIPDANLTMEQNLINSVSRSTLGFNIFGGLKNRFKNLGNTTKAIGSLVISFMLGIGGTIGLATGSAAPGGAVLFLALIFAYYAIIKLLKRSLFGNFSFKKKFFPKKKSKENKQNELEKGAKIVYSSKANLSKSYK
ncbi:Plasmodium exported protein, unknown function [Plasmodium vivax]|uniref:Uncharacterized protein n=1 Tax=Plasmodium vivax TaxID=5855 RepID=A0A1G4GRL7_PLAVI|nr:Plasmodium exported protein, unknown function [Plasmodium vivax]